MELFLAQVADGGIANFTEVMGKNLCGQAYGNAFCSLCQQQRIFHRQHDGLFVSAVVGKLPLGGLGVEDGVQGKLRQAGFDVTGSSGTVAGKDVAPVALSVDEQFFLSHLYQGVADRGIAVGVELHGVSHDVCHLIISAVVHALHRVQDAALNGFQTVFYMRDGTVENGIGGIVQKPVLVHAAQVVHH